MRSLLLSLTLCSTYIDTHAADRASVHNCISCSLRDNKISTIGGLVANTQHFSVQQDYVVPIPGFMIISSTRHIYSIDEFTNDERADFIELVYQVRHAMRMALGIQVVYMIEEEDAEHFHLWLFPRYEWMNMHGRKIKSVKQIMLWAQKNLNTTENRQEIERAAHAIRDFMLPF